MPMKLCDKSVSELVRACKDGKTDVYISPDVFPAYEDITSFLAGLKCKTLCLFPGCPPILNLSDTCLYSVGKFYGDLNSHILFASAEALYEDEFCGFITKNGFEEILLIFAENAEKYTYGYSRGMSLLGEFRASYSGYIHLTAVFADIINGREAEFAEIFLSGKYVSLSGERKLSFVQRVAKTQKHSPVIILDEFEKTATGHTVVFFSERRTAACFSRLLKSKGIPCGLYHGGQTDEEHLLIVKAFRDSEKGIVAATKSFLTAAAFAGKFESLYCGVPPTDLFAKQILAVSENKALTCVFCTDDIKQNIKIRCSAAALYQGAEQKAFSDFRSRKLSDMIDLLESN